ncbi:hypothetical protein BDY21DRAFT_4784 [Lineolata rhizophorae]|uniref:Uncharacterized protein n=1 Tax=Lineolata rhizophorae TaxID=578093 RepID=A0A6A6PDB8_9PEZI|nr:hypothetical protein BDY21DRAFT_4784 [Lineolata rhizophorae]
MGNRHNRRRTRSRPRNRNRPQSNHARGYQHGCTAPLPAVTAGLPFSHAVGSSVAAGGGGGNIATAFAPAPPPGLCSARFSPTPSLSSQSSFASASSSLNQFPAHRSPVNHWHHQYAAWQERAALQRREQADCDERRRKENLVRVFGGEADDEVSLCEPMLKVVMALFDDIDYVDP